MTPAEAAPIACTLNSATRGQGPRGCRTATAPPDRVVGASAVLAATGALVCSICCVLPFALPAVALAVGGGVISWAAKATPWANGIGLVAVLAGWAWVTVQSVRTKRRPARSTLLILGLATAVFAAAAAWWHFEREIIHLLR